MTQYLILRVDEPFDPDNETVFDALDRGAEWVDTLTCDPRDPPTGHPMQPLVVDAHGVVRFKMNRIVETLRLLGARQGMDMNAIAEGGFTQEDNNQFAQLIGYSVSGWGDLSYAMDVEEADRRVAELLGSAA